MLCNVFPFWINWKWHKSCLKMSFVLSFRLLKKTLCYTYLHRQILLSSTCSFFVVSLNPAMRLSVSFLLYFLKSPSKRLRPLGLRISSSALITSSTVGRSSGFLWTHLRMSLRRTPLTRPIWLLSLWGSGNSPMHISHMSTPKLYTSTWWNGTQRWFYLIAWFRSWSISRPRLISVLFLLNFDRSTPPPVLKSLW